MVVLFQQVKIHHHVSSQEDPILYTMLFHGVILQSVVTISMMLHAALEGLLHDHAYW